MNGLDIGPSVHDAPRPAHGPTMRILTAIPVYNEEKHLEPVLARGPPLRRRRPRRRRRLDRPDARAARRLPDGPGRSATRRTAATAPGSGAPSARTIEGGYDGLVTLDCDGQHEPRRIPEIAAGLADADIVSGSRYLQVFDPSQVPPDRAAADQRRGHPLAQRVPRPQPDRRLLRLQGVSRPRPWRSSTSPTTATRCRSRSGSRRSSDGLTIVEVPVPLIYLDESRAFGGALDDATYRLNHYRTVFREALERSGLARGRGAVADAGPPPPRPEGRRLDPRRAAARSRPSHARGRTSRRLAGWDHDFQGRRYSVLRPKARAEALAGRDPLSRGGRARPARRPRPRRGPIVVTGHQPELFHPGVWVKNFAVAGLAAAGRRRRRST